MISICIRPDVNVYTRNKNSKRDKQNYDERNTFRSSVSASKFFQ
jgi:hypothetical protein